jgi:DNA-binding transcriptional MerR regulator
MGGRRRVDDSGADMASDKASDDEQMTIDELARAAGLVVSTVRLYQTRRLLPPPERRGRVGWYGPDHLARLRVIAQLQERGFSLAAIKELVEGLDRGDSLGALLGLGDGASPWPAEAPRRMSLAELAEHLPHAPLDDRMVQRIVGLGLVEIDAERDEAVVHSPTFLRTGSDLMELGVPADVILDEYEALQGQMAQVAQRFTEVFRTHIWEPFAKEGMPVDHVDALVGALERLGPLAEGVVTMALRDALQRAAGEFIDDEAARLGLDLPRPGARPGVG